MPGTEPTRDPSQALSGIGLRRLFSKPFSAAITERVWHASQQIQQRRNGKVELRLRALPGIELGRWILSWTPDVGVLAPKALRDRVQPPSATGPSKPSVNR